MNATARVALVTGGAVRVGRAIVEELTSAGFSVAFSFKKSVREARQLEAALASSGTEAMAFEADVADPGARRALLEGVEARFGGLDVLVNSAAVFPATPIASLDEETFRAVLRINLEAPTFLALAAAPLLQERAGCVVNVADIYGLFPLRQHLAYSVSKAALIAATKALAVELAPGVRVNAVAPGIALFPPGYDEESKQRLINRTLLKRPGDPQEIARAVRYLVEGTSTMTGQILIVDGGRTVTL